MSEKTYGAWSVPESIYQAALKLSNDDGDCWQLVRYCRGDIFQRDAAERAVKRLRATAERERAYRIMAAAPDLYEAIKVAIVFDDRRKALSGGKPPTTGQWETFIALARAAITKAEGGAA